MKTILLNNKEIELPFFGMSKDGKTFYKADTVHTMVIEGSDIKMPLTKPEWVHPEIVPIPRYKFIESFNNAIALKREALEKWAKEMSIEAGIEPVNHAVKIEIPIGEGC